VGSCGFAILQRYGRRKTDREIRDRGGEETIWDVVILDNGIRADVVGTQRVEQAGSIRAGIDERPASFISARGDPDPIQAVQRNVEPASMLPQISLPVEVRRDWSDGEIRQYVMNQLPPGTQFSVRTETVTAKTITVDVFDPDNSDIEAPPGTLMIEERFHHEDTDWGKRDDHTNLEHIPRHTIVFQTTWNSTHNADLRHEEANPLIIEPRAHEGNDHTSVDDVDGQSHEASVEDVDMPLVVDATSAKSPQDTPMFEIDAADGDDEIQTPRASSIPVPATDTLDDLTCAFNSRANQKRPRKPVSSSSSLSSSDSPKGNTGKSALSKFAAKVKPTHGEKLDKTGPFRKALRKTLSPSQSTTSFKDMVSLGGAANERKSTSARNGVANTLNTSKIPVRAGASGFNRPNNNRLEKTLPRLPSQGMTSSSKARTSGAALENPRSSSRTSFYSVHEKQRESVVTQTDTYSLHSVETRPGSPSLNRTHLRATSGLARAKSEKDIALQVTSSERPNSRTSNHRRSKPDVPSIYSVATSSQTSLVLAPRPRRSVFEDRKTMMSLTRDGRVPGIYPDKHLAYSMGRFARFSSASYGSQFLHYMGISATLPKLSTQELMHHHEHQSFSRHTGLPPNAILMSPFVDPSGGSNAAGETSSGVPLVYYLSLDKESKAVVLTFRGTLGFEDILTDMTCDYDEMQWQGKSYKVHKGMHASARRLLSSVDLIATIKASLETSPDWGLVLCGHSLGGGVAALLALLISEAGAVENSGSSFVTKSSPSHPQLLLTNGTLGQSPPSLPAGRPIHVYAYGPPATISEPLRLATRGLITTIVNGEDVVPCLSLGVLRDFQSVALKFKTDDTGAKSQLGKRLWESFINTIRNKFYVNQPPLDFTNDPSGTIGDDHWAWAALKALRAGMQADKLLPPGEVYVVETMPVLRRDAFMADAGDICGYPKLGRPATRVQMKWVRDVQDRFGEIRFGSRMLGDHSPGRYEASLAALARGVLED
jgi:hypothetical protein